MAAAAHEDVAGERLAAERLKLFAAASDEARTGVLAPQIACLQRVSDHLSALGSSANQGEHLDVHALQLDQECVTRQLHELRALLAGGKKSAPGL